MTLPRSSSADDDAPSRKEDSAVVLFSGGQDSTTCLAWALTRFGSVYTFGVDYGQRHLVELTVRPRLLLLLRNAFPEWSERLKEDRTISVDALHKLSDTSLTRDKAIEFASHGLPNTFVPGRNLLFLTFAAAFAYRVGAKHLVTGVCETDYGGYPDCRDDAMKALQVALNIGMTTRFVIDTPLMWRDKKATWDLAQELGGARLVEIVREETHTCYLGDRTHPHDWGWGCGGCPACELRKTGYERFVAAQG